MIYSINARLLGLLVTIFAAVTGTVTTSMYAMEQDIQRYKTVLEQSHELQEKLVKAALQYALMHHDSILNTYGFPPANTSLSTYLLCKAYDEVIEQVLKSNNPEATIKNIEQEFSPLASGTIPLVIKNPIIGEDRAIVALLLYTLRHHRDILEQLYATPNTQGQPLCQAIGKTLRQMFPTFIRSNEYKQIVDQIVTHRQQFVKEAQSNPSKTLLQQAVDYNYPEVIQNLIQRHHIMPDIGDLQRTKEYYQQAQSPQKKESYKRIGQLLLRALALTTPQGRISQEGITPTLTGVYGLPPELIEYIATFYA